MPCAVGERVAHVPHVARLFLGDDLQVRYRRVQHRVPVNEPFPPIDQPLLEQPYEDLAHGVREPLVHGEALVLPVQRRPQPPQLAGDGAAGLRLPLPDAVDECLAAQVVARLALGLQLTLDNHLGGDAGMVRARLPEGLVAAHAVVADQRIHEAVVEAMAHVQAAGDVRRRDHDAVGTGAIGCGLCAGIEPWREPAGVLPALVPLGFDAVGVVGLVQHDCLERRQGRPCQGLRGRQTGAARQYSEALRVGRRSERRPPQDQCIRCPSAARSSAIDFTVISIGA